MKKTLLTLILTSIVSFSIYAKDGQSGQIHTPNSVTRVAACDCWQQRDLSWSVVHFDGSGGSGGPGTPPDYRNDDWSSDTIHLPFIFCFYGDTIREIYINNNGNISIDAPHFTFTANSFPDSTYRMIAPFWSDVDTRDSITPSGLVYYKLASNYLIVQWDHVGYYGVHADLLNTYQLVITDGNASILPETKNVGFCYRDMQYTTGDASGGAGGFGGTPATVGVNYGNGINYLQIGLYDNNSIAYDGPYGLNDGIDALDNQSFAFNVCVQNFNVPPILSGDYICDTATICLGDTFTYEASFISPEQGQITTVTSNNHGLTGVNLLTNPGNQASIYLSFVAAQIGTYTIDIIGSDDGSPSASSSIPLYFNIQSCTIGIEENSANNNLVYPNPVKDELYLELKNSSNKVIVTDISGREVYRATVGQKATINTKDWSKGIYFVSINSSGKTTSTHKIVKD